MASRNAQAIIDHVIDQHIKQRLAVMNAYLTDAQFHHDVQVLRRTLAVVCDAAQHAGIPYDTTRRILAATVEQLVEAPNPNLIGACHG